MEERDISNSDVLHELKTPLLTTDVKKSKSTSVANGRGNFNDVDEHEESDTVPTLSHQESTCLDTKNAAAKIEINSRVDELNKLSDKLIAKLENLKLDEVIRFLEDEEDNIDESYSSQNLATYIFTRISMMGGVILVVGAISSLSTAGTSLGLVLAGGVIVGVGSFGSIVTRLCGKVRRQWILRWKCKRKLRKTQLDTEEIGQVYETFCSECIKFYEEYGRLNIENLKDLNPCILKYSVIGHLNKLNKTAVAGKAITTGIRLSNLAVKTTDSIYLEYLGRSIIPITKEFLILGKTFAALGTAVTCIGIAIDIGVCRDAFLKSLGFEKCSESKRLLFTIQEVKNNAKVIESYLKFLKEDHKDFLQKYTEQQRLQDD